METFRLWLSSNLARTIVFSIGALLVALLIFHAGVAIGERRALSRMHGVRPGMLPPAALGFLPHGFLPGGHGVVGTIAQVSLPTLTITTRGGGSEQVLLSSSTVVHGDAGPLTQSDLSAGEQIIVLGEPPSDESATSAVDARFIHIFSTSASSSQPN